PTTLPRSPNHSAAPTLARVSTTAQCTPPCTMPYGWCSFGSAVQVATTSSPDALGVWMPRCSTNGPGGSGAKSGRGGTGGMLADREVRRLIGKFAIRVKNNEGAPFHLPAGRVPDDHPAVPRRAHGTGSGPDRTPEQDRLLRTHPEQRRPGRRPAAAAGA